MYFNSSLLIGVIAERGYKEHGCEDFDDKDLAGEWYAGYNIQHFIRPQ